MLQQTVLLSALMLALSAPLASAQQEQPADSTTTGPTTMSPSQMESGMGPGQMGPGMGPGRMRAGGRGGAGMIDDAESDTSIPARWEIMLKRMEAIAATDDLAQRHELMQQYREEMRQFMADRGRVDGSQRGMMHRAGPGKRSGDGTGYRHGHKNSDRHSNRHAQGHHMGPGAMAYSYMMPNMTPMMTMSPMHMMGGPGMMCNPYMMPNMHMMQMPPMHGPGMQGAPQGRQLDSRLQLIEERLDELQALLEERLDSDGDD